MPEHSQPLQLAEALARIRANLRLPTATERVRLGDARYRIAAQDVLAPIDLPPFPASAMDGYAIRAADLGHRLRIVGESLAGHPYLGSIGPGECVRVFTGAQMPEHSNQVVLQEEVAVTDGTTVEFQRHAPAESYIRPPAHDVARGAVLACQGDVLDPLLLGSLAAAGVAEIDVFARPAIGVFSTGDELVDPGTPPANLTAGQIYDSNRFTVLQLLQGMPLRLEDLGRLPDDPSSTHTRLAEAGRRCDALITSGGVSVGDADFVTSALAQLGRLDFWRLNLKPGKPMAYGQIGQCIVFGLPGNPVSTIVTLLLVARPALWALAGAAHPPEPWRTNGVLIDTVHHQPGRTEYQRGLATWTAGALQVTHSGDQSSNRLRSFAGANCLIEVPGPVGDLSAGEQVTVLPFRGLLG